MVWVGRNLKDHPVPIPCRGQEDLLLDQVAQDPIQPGLEYFQGLGINYLSGQLVPAFHNSLHKTFLPSGFHQPESISF